MILDHQDRQRLLAEGKHPDLKSGTPDEWREWVNANYPYSPEYHRKLIKRYQRPAPGSLHELLDLCGLPDRSQAANLARLWFHLGTRDYERSFDSNERFKRVQEARVRDAQQAAANQESPRAHSKRGRAQAWQE